MNITNVITLLGGIALFLFGMTFMANGLEKMSGGRLERILERMTNNVFKGVLLGALVTALIQSSSATTVMVVGFVNSGIMKLAQTVGIIMGANIGTTATSLILGLNDIGSTSSFFLQLLKPSSLAPIISIIGIILYLFSSRGGNKNTAGQILLGFGVLFFGMLTMESAVAPLADVPEFGEILTRFSNPLFGLLAGMLLTAIIQSSSASVGILQALSSTGAIPFSAAAPIILGQNIGTCVTALISSIGANKNAKRAALIHLYFNIIGTVIFLIAIYAVQTLIGLPFWDDIVNRSMIATFHLVFNVVTTLLLLPFHKGILWLATKTVRDAEAHEKVEESSVLDERFLSSPSVALARAHDAVVQMSRLASLNFSDSVSLLMKFDENVLERVKVRENNLDRLEVGIEHYLLKLTDRELSDKENLQHMQLLHSTGDVERIGDYAINVAEAAQERVRLGASFSESAKKELKAISSAVEEILTLTIECYIHDDVEEARRIEPIEQVIDLMTEMLKTRHIARLKKGTCQTETGTLFLELLINFERIADHCSNIALYVIQADINAGSAGLFDAHEYVRKLHQGKKDEYNQVFEEYKSTYLEPLLSLEI